MEHGRGSDEIEANGRGHRVLVEARGGALKRPGHVLDVDDESPGIGGRRRGPIRVMRNGTTPSHATPSNSSSSSDGGTSARNGAASTGQCANRRSCQDIRVANAPRITGASGGIGRGSA